MPFRRLIRGSFLRVAELTGNAMKTILFFLIQLTWGIIQSLIGFVLFLVNIRKMHYLYHGAVVTEWNSYSSVSLGLFVFVTGRRVRDRRSGGVPPEELKRALLVHEYGHTIQSLILGPFYLPLIGLPSLIWATLPGYRARRRGGLPYSSFWTERSANRFGEKVTKEASLRDAVM